MAINLVKIGDMQEMNYSGYQNYKDQSVMTMTQGELLIVLFDELIKRLTRAEFAIDNEKFDVFDQSIDRSQEIVEYLKASLDFNYEISAEINRMYDFFLYEISRIKAGRKKEIIAELKPLVKELRDTFEEASAKAGI